MNFTKIRELKGFTVYGPWKGRFENGPMITVDGFSIDFYGGNGLFHRGIGQFDVKILVFVSIRRHAFCVCVRRRRKSVGISFACRRFFA